MTLTFWALCIRYGFSYAPAFVAYAGRAGRFDALWENYAFR